MTRVNLVPPQELYDQHLFAEWRELKMIPKSLQRSLAARGLEGVVKMVPPAFTLNKGHVSFFYDKGQYLFERFELLRYELKRRAFNFDEGAELDDRDVYLRHPSLLGSYTPTAEALVIIRERIAQRVALKPHWYRYRGDPFLSPPTGERR